MPKVISGYAAPQFDAVRTAFAQGFAAGDELGASLCVYLDGLKRVDLCGGTADEAISRPWERDTTAIVYSATKGALAIVLAGTRAAEILQNQAPTWTPGSAHGYHAVTVGWLVSTLLSKARGRPADDVFREMIAEPLALDFTIGQPAAGSAPVAMLRDDDRQRRPTTHPPADRDTTVIAAAIRAAAQDPGSMLAHTMTTTGALPIPDAATWNQPRVYGASAPAVSGITNARSLATPYAATIGEVAGVRLFSQRTLEAATREQVSGADRVLFISTRFATGFQLPSQMVTMLSDSSFGHCGGRRRTRLRRPRISDRIRLRAESIAVEPRWRPPYRGDSQRPAICGELRAGTGPTGPEAKGQAT